MRVLIFEQWQGGHYSNYLECLIPRLSELADEVVVCMTGRAAASDEFQYKLAPLQRLKNVLFDHSVPIADPSLPPKERPMLARHLLAAVKRTQPDHTLVPSADAQAVALSIANAFGSNPFRGGNPIEATFHYGYGSAMRNWKHRAKELVYSSVYRHSPFQYLNFVNFLYLEHAKERREGWVSRTSLVGDPVPQCDPVSRSHARAMLGIEDSGRYAGLLGSLDERKAIPELLAAFRSAKVPSSDKLLLAGRLAEPYRQLINNAYADLVRSGRLVIIDRFLSENELLQGYAALDVVTPVYYDFPGLASLLLKGLAAERPVLVHDFGWSGAIVRRFHAGHATDIYDMSRFAVDLANAYERSDSYVHSAATRRLLRFHRPENFTENMVERVRLRVDKPRKSDSVTWDWVMTEEGASSANQAHD